MPRWRCNTILSKIVPKLIVLYIVLAYRLIVVDYSWHCVLSGAQGYSINNSSLASHARTLLWLAFLHVLLTLVCGTYLHIFLAKERDFPRRQGSDRFRVGASLASSPREPPADVTERRVIFECDAQGEPLRCHRDACNGRWKPPRTRHCGDCKTCRPGFDHHCPWFDADITAPETMASFLAFLALVPVLITSAFAPLYKTIFAHIMTIYEHAKSSASVDAKWWSRRISWLGGPIYRWCVGFVLGAREMKSNRVRQDLYAEQRRARISEPNMTLIVLFICGLGFTVVAIGLLISTMRQILRGDLTIDVEIRKRQRPSAGSIGSSVPARYFWVPSTDTKQSVAIHSNGVNHQDGAFPISGSIVAMPIAANPYAQQSWQDNVRLLLRHRYQESERVTSWPLSAETLGELQLRAQEMTRKNR